MSPVQEQPRPGRRLRLPFPRRQKEPPQSVGDVLRSLMAEVDGETIAIREIISRLGDRSFGLCMLLFALPSCLPMPPGVPMICGAVIALIGIQLAAGVRRLWLPRFLADREIRRDDFVRMLEKAMPYVERAERHLKPRMKGFIVYPARMVTGLLCAFLGFLQFLPIPFLGNMPPGVAAVFIALGLSDRDGLFILIGWVLGFLASAITIIATYVALAGLSLVF